MMLSPDSDHDTNRLDTESSSICPSLVTKENVPFAVSSSMGMRVSFAGPREGRGGGGGGVDVTGAPPPRLTAAGDVARGCILVRRRWL